MSSAPAPGLPPRTRWVDYAKGIGITLVVYGHVARGLVNARLPVATEPLRTIDNVIYTFHMPLFFFLAGLFLVSSLERRGWRGLLATKLETLVYPYLLWSLLQGGLEVALSHFTNGNATLAEVGSLLWHPRAQFWFLYALFFVNLTALPFFRGGARRHPVALLCLAVMAYLGQTALPQAWFVPMLTANLCFFAFGIGFDRIQPWVSRHCGLLAAAGGVAFVVGQYWFTGYRILPYTHGGLPGLAIAAVSIFFVVSTSMFLARWHIPLLAHVGSASMTIYLAHVVAGSATRIALRQGFGCNDPAVHLLAGVIAGVAAPIVAASLAPRLGCGWLFAAPAWLTGRLAATRPAKRATTSAKVREYA